MSSKTTESAEPFCCWMVIPLVIASEGTQRSSPACTLGFADSPPSFASEAIERLAWSATVAPIIQKTLDLFRTAS